MRSVCTAVQTNATEYLEGFPFPGFTFVPFAILNSHLALPTRWEVM